MLDRLHQRSGQTLGELCEHVDMRRQSLTQHLDVLEAANLVGAVRRGRDKLYYLNPVPLHEIQERWIYKFERARLRGLRDVKRRAEDGMSERPRFVYVTYIESTPENVWEALTDADVTAAYKIEPYGEVVRLTLTHENLVDVAERAAASAGWAAVLSNLKSLIETRSPFRRSRGSCRGIDRRGETRRAALATPPEPPATCPESVLPCPPAVVIARSRAGRRPRSRRRAGGTHKPPRTDASPGPPRTRSTPRRPRRSGAAAASSDCARPAVCDEGCPAQRGSSDSRARGRRQTTSTASEVEPA